MTKRSQITIFILLGVIVLFVFALIAYFIQSQVSNRIGYEKQGLLAGGRYQDLQVYVEECIKETADKGAFSSGINSLAPYVNNNLEDCVNLSYFVGSNFETGKVDTQISKTIDNRTLQIEVAYPIEIIGKDTRKHLDKFYLKYPLANSVEIALSNGATREQASISSTDDKAKLAVPGGTKIYGAHDNQTATISIKLDEPHRLMENDSIGYIMYGLEPEGAQFDPPIKLELHYDESIFGGGFNESDLIIIQLSDAKKEIVSYDVDIEKNIIYGSLSHFSGIILGSSSSPSIKLQMIPGTQGKYSFNGLPIELYRWINHYDGRFAYGALIRSNKVSGEQPAVIRNIPYNYFSHANEPEDIKAMQNPRKEVNMPQKYIQYPCSNGACPINMGTTEISSIYNKDRSRMDWYINHGYSVFLIYSRFYTAHSLLNDIYDVQSGILALSKLRGIDENRIAITGRSRGGQLSIYPFMVDANPVTSRFDTLKIQASVPFVPPVDRGETFEYFFGTGPGRLRTIQPPELYIKSKNFASPYYNRRDINNANWASWMTYSNAADKVQVPMLLISGTDDFLVPATQTGKFFRELKAKGKPVKKMIYLNGPPPYTTLGLSHNHGVLDKYSNIKQNWIAQNFIVSRMPPDISQITYKVVPSMTSAVDEVNLIGLLDDIKSLICYHTDNFEPTTMMEPQALADLLLDAMNPIFYYESDDKRISDGSGKKVLTEAVNYVFKTSWSDKDIWNNLANEKLSENCPGIGNPSNISSRWSSIFVSKAGRVFENIHSLEQSGSSVKGNSSSGRTIDGTVVGNKYRYLVYDDNYWAQTICAVAIDEKSMSCTWRDSDGAEGKAHMTRLDTSTANVSGKWSGVSAVSDDVQIDFVNELSQNGRNVRGKSLTSGRTIEGTVTGNLFRYMTYSSSYWAKVTCSVQASDSYLYCTWHDSGGAKGVATANKENIAPSKVAGAWAVTIVASSGKAFDHTHTFQQTGSSITGKSSTGRTLKGIVTGNSLAYTVSGNDYWSMLTCSVSSDETSMSCTWHDSGGAKGTATANKKSVQPATDSAGNDPGSGGAASSSCFNQCMNEPDATAESCNAWCTAQSSNNSGVKDEDTKYTDSSCINDCLAEAGNTQAFCENWCSAQE